MRARRAALDALRAVQHRDAYANLLLPGLLRSRGLTGSDAARATDLTYGTLRGLGTFDAILAACADRPLDAIDPEVLDALRLGTYQLLGTRVPAHAAVSTTVDLVRSRRGAGAAGFANAVLRHVAETDLAGWTDRLAPAAAVDPVGHLAFAHQHPRWVAEAFAAALGEHRDRLAAVLAADNAAPAVTVAALPQRSTVDELVATGARPGRWAPTAARLGGGDPTSVPAIAQGRARVQDEGSQLVTWLTAQAPITGDEHRWLDMCAGPGGKTVLLAALARGRGVQLLAGELHAHRARLVARAVHDAGLHPGVAVVQADATRPPWHVAQFDRVLLDAPCTGLGALRRRPEARWRRRPADLRTLLRLQRSLLRTALDSVRPGGVVGYVTCSPHQDETEGVLRTVLDERVDIEVLDVPALASHVPDAGRGRYLQLWPDLHGTDAMFLALLRPTG
jgi:16S rRNA (cytosine967-C5)-methyltransferase